MIEKLFRFHGGIHPPGNKSDSIARPITVAPIPERLAIPLHQHAGRPAKPLVKPGDKVLKGQAIGAADGELSAAVHATTSGTVLAIAQEPVAHPSEPHGHCVVLEADGEDRAVEPQPLDYRTLQTEQLIERLREAGVVGLGGAAFPSAVKLAANSGHKMHTLVINGAECEPYITCDDLQMRERGGEIVRGIEILHHILGSPETLLLAIEDNKPRAFAAMQAAARQSEIKLEVIQVPTIYPSGGAKQLVHILTGIEIPAGQHAPDFGVQCFNTGTAYSIHCAVNLGEPVISRVVTVAGNVREPQNFDVRIGTAFSVLVELAGEKPDTDGYLMGGPLMGFRVPSKHVPVVKGTICILVASPKLFPEHRVMPCIRCGMCAQACPVELQPHELYWFAKNRNFAKAADYSLADCIECGACSYVCPSHIPLVQYYKMAKHELRNEHADAEAANLARHRYEARQLRLQRKDTVTNLDSTAQSDDNDAGAKQAAVEGALRRARARQDKLSGS